MGKAYSQSTYLLCLAPYFVYLLRFTLLTLFTYFVLLYLLCSFTSFYSAYFTLLTFTLTRLLFHVTHLTLELILLLTRGFELATNDYCNGNIKIYLLLRQAAILVL